jgi:hypothetical protein
VAHLPDGERVVLDRAAGRRRHLEERIGLDRDLVARDRPVDALERECGGDVDRDDPRVRVRRAHEVDVAHPMTLHVVEEEALALDEPLVLLARDRLADEALLESGLLLGDGGHAFLPPTATTASTIMRGGTHGSPTSPLLLRFAVQ